MNGSHNRHWGKGHGQTDHTIRGERHKRLHGYLRHLRQNTCAHLTYRREAPSCGRQTHQGDVNRLRRRAENADAEADPHALARRDVKH